MGIDVQVQDERGGVIKQLLDPRSLVKKLLPLHESTQTTCLRFIDPVGDTTFNQLQIPVLLGELITAVRICRDPQAKGHGEQLVSLIEGADGQVHTYVKFIGD
jgi:hypothetical protein